jgi:putative redox protein
MNVVTVTWQPEQERFEAVGAHPGQRVVINAPRESPEATGFSPKELLLAGAGSCSAWDVVEILRKKRQEPTAVEVEVRGEQQDDVYPQPFTRVTLVYRVSGTGVTRAAVERAVQLSIERYCPVIATIRGVAEILTEIEIVPA